jgi:predicted dehydrogenase
MIRVGLIGAGVIADIHTGSFKNIDGAAVTKIFATSRDDREALARKRGVEAVDSADEIIHSGEIDVVLVATPTATHADYAVRALQAGKHVFCEKPMALSVLDADRMIRAAEESGRVLMIGLVLRWFHEFERLKKLIDARSIGDVRIIRTTRAAGFPRGRDDWYADYDKSGGLAVDMMNHDYDFLRWCFGDVQRVMARGLATRGLDHVDYCLVLMRFESGVIAHVEGSWAHPAGTFFTRAELAGTAGLISFDSRRAVPFSIARRETARGGPGVAVPESPVDESPYLREMRHFFAVVRGEETLAVTPEHARESLRIALAVNASMATGGPIVLSELSGR